MGAYYCAICRQTAFNGKGHIFGKHHQSRLRLVLMKFIEKVMELTFRGSMMQSNRECVGDFQIAAENVKDRERWKRMIRCGDPRLGSPKGKEVKEARRTLKKPEVEKFDCTQHKKTFWCYCCGQEVERNVSDGNMTVLHGGLLEHMATPEHRKSTHKFWWENKADPKLKDKVIITHEETQRFKVEVAKVLETFVEQEDEFIKQQAELIQAQEKRRQELLESLVEHEAEPESSHRPNGTETAAEAGVSFQGTSPGGHRQTGRSLVDSMVDAQQQGLTFIGYQDAANSGNVHTGAVPPWFQDDDPLEGTSTSATPLEIGPSCQEFLRQKEQEKLRKLPPNRVGANFDHSSHTDANWLPSFGRVWNSGRRWQSRHQFRQEEGQKNKVKRRMKQGAEGSKKAKMATDD